MPHSKVYVIECPKDTKHWRVRCLYNQEIICHSEDYYSKWNRDRAAKQLGKMTRWRVETTTA
jgi:uncharacterized protein YegP (UPF0339 family)